MMGFVDLHALVTAILISGASVQVGEVQISLALEVSDDDLAKMAKLATRIIDQSDRERCEGDRVQS